MEIRDLREKELPEVTYQWKSDAMVQFVLYSSENGQVEKYTLTTEDSTAVLDKYG